MNYKKIVGLETHVELNTESKMFCGCSASYFGKEPNSRVCPVCLGLPGALPVPNEQAIKWTILIALALNCKINRQSYFERKHYFYPDLPKGYQISQFLMPFGYGGYLDVNGKRIRITRVHLEEDTGKLLHGQQFGDQGASYVDFNRSGVPLVEIVTEPDLETGDEAASYLKQLQLIIRYLEVSDCDMEKGSMRCEPNISIVSQAEWQQTHQLPDYKIEVKNINSFRFVKKAIDYEDSRQTLILEQGKKPIQETRRYLESSGKTEPMRTKEFAHDYRYFPEPDIPPFEFNHAYLEQIKTTFSKLQLPRERELQLREYCHLTPEASRLLTENKALGDKFLAVVKLDTNINPQQLASLLINQKISSKLLPREIIEQAKARLSKKTVSQEVLTKTILDILDKNPKAIADYRSGKHGSIQFLLGQILETLGRQVEVKNIIAELQRILKR